MSEGRFRVALTIDTEHPDRPGGDPDGAKVVDTLRVERAPATFFLQGRWALANPDVAAQIAGDGHLIGNHSFFHARMPRLTDDGIAYDLATAQEAIIEATGIDPRPWFRCPCGDGHDDPRVSTAVARRPATATSTGTSTPTTGIRRRASVRSWRRCSTPSHSTATARSC